jgi:predicted RNA-binding Zn-ribbon protein involved in translation (DUF1610 family)
MARYARCPNCGNMDESGVYRCDKCRKLCCDACGGEYTPHDIWWGLTGMGRPARRRCPRCGSEAEWIGSIKRQA